MANYVINKTDLSGTITIQNATLYQKLTLDLVGQNYVGFGQTFAENTLKLLENSYNSTAPDKAVRGQLWYDSLNNLMKVWTGEDPVDPSYTPGDSSKLPANASYWKVVGPAGIDNGEIGTVGTPYSKIYVDDVFATNGEFETLFVGLAGIGCTLTSTGISPAPTSTNDISGLTLGSTSNIFKESHVRNESVYGKLIFKGGSNTAYLMADSSISNTIIPDPAQPQSVNLGSNTAINKRFASVNAVAFDGKTLVLSTATSEGVGSSLVPTTTALYNLGSNSRVFNEIYGNDVNTQTITPQSNTATIGASMNKFDVVYANTFDGTATQAEYADLAERYESDGEYDAGTVVKIGGTKEITQTTSDCDVDVFGVISTAPAYMMNSAAGNNATHPYVALVGRVPVKVVGKVSKGQRLVSSSMPGVARAATGSEPCNAIIGRSLQNKQTDECEKIEIVVGLK